MDEPQHARLQREAVALEGEAHALLLAGDPAGAGPLLREAAARYRASWEEAPPRAFGRLIGMLKAAVLAGDATDAARYTCAEIGQEGDSPPSWYALAIAALIQGDDGLAARAAEAMRAGSEPFQRAAEAIAALAGRDRDRYTAALQAIVDDFGARDAHLTGVAIADTAVMLERLAAPRGLAGGIDSALLPAVES